MANNVPYTVEGNETVKNVLLCQMKTITSFSKLKARNFSQKKKKCLHLL